MNYKIKIKKFTQRGEGQKTENMKDALEDIIRTATITFEVVSGDKTSYYEWDLAQSLLGPPPVDLDLELLDNRMLKIQKQYVKERKTLGDHRAYIRLNNRINRTKKTAKKSKKMWWLNEWMSRFTWDYCCVPLSHLGLYGWCCGVWWLGLFLRGGGGKPQCGRDPVDLPTHSHDEVSWLFPSNHADIYSSYAGALDAARPRIRGVLVGINNINKWRSLESTDLSLSFFSIKSASFKSFRRSSCVNFFSEGWP